MLRPLGFRQTADGDHLLDGKGIGRNSQAECQDGKTGLT